MESVIKEPHSARGKPRKCSRITNAAGRKEGHNGKLVEVGNKHKRLRLSVVPVAVFPSFCKSCPVKFPLPYPPPPNKEQTLNLLKPSYEAPYTLNPKPYTLNPKPEILKPHTLNTNPYAV